MHVKTFLVLCARVCLPINNPINLMPPTTELLATSNKKLGKAIASAYM